jgi:hypothetical protein
LEKADLDLVRGICLNTETGPGQQERQKNGKKGKSKKAPQSGESMFIKILIKNVLKKTIKGTSTEIRGMFFAASHVHNSPSNAGQ